MTPVLFPTDSERTKTGPDTNRMELLLVVLFSSSPTQNVHPPKLLQDLVDLSTPPSSLKVWSHFYIMSIIKALCSNFCLNLKLDMQMHNFEFGDWSLEFCYFFLNLFTFTSKSLSFSCIIINAKFLFNVSLKIPFKKKIIFLRIPF